MSSNTPENQYAQPAPYGKTASFGQQPGGHPGAPMVPATDPGKTMAIIAVILPFVGVGLLGLILGLIAKSKSKKAGYKNTLALVAIIISAVPIVASIVAGIVLGITSRRSAHRCRPGLTAPRL